MTNDQSSVMQLFNPISRKRLLRSAFLEARILWCCSFVNDKTRMKTRISVNAEEPTNQEICQEMKKGDVRKMSCSRCGKMGKQQCSQLSCLKCCTDNDCIAHASSRLQSKEKESILNGTHPVNVMANEKRKQIIQPGIFAETSFKYTGDSVIIFSLRDYLSDPKIRNDAIRKSKRRCNRNK